METRKTTLTKTNELAPNRHDARKALETALPFSPLMPWFDPTSWLRIEYQRIEIRLEDGRTRIQGERRSFRDGKLTEEKIEATAPAKLYPEAVGQMQRQAQVMMEALLMPWATLMVPFLSRRHDR